MRLREKDEAMQKIEADFSKDLAAAQYATDTTESRMGSRALLEGALDVIWATHMAAKHQHAEAWQSCSRRMVPALACWPTCRQAAADNGVKEAELLRQAGKLYDVLGERH